MLREFDDRIAPGGVTVAVDVSRINVAGGTATAFGRDQSRLQGAVRVIETDGSLLASYTIIAIAGTPRETRGGAVVGAVINSSPRMSIVPDAAPHVTLAVLVTPIFNSARGSLLWPMLFHWQLINPFWPDAQPWDTVILVVVTVVVVWWNRSTMFTRQGAETEVVPSNAGRAPRAAE